MKQILFTTLLSLLLTSCYSQQNLRGNRISADTIKHSSVSEIPSWPATGLKEFYHRDTLKAIDSLGVIHYLTKADKTFTHEISTNGETNIATTINLNANCKVYYNGSLIPGSEWTGIDTYRISFPFPTYQYDFFTINRGSK